MWSPGTRLSSILPSLIVPIALAARPTSSIAQAAPPCTERGSVVESRRPGFDLASDLGLHPWFARAPRDARVLAEGASPSPGPLGGIPDGSGGMICVARVWRHGLAEVLIQRLNSSGAPLWGSHGVTVCTTASEQFDPSIAADGTGGVVVAWIDQRTGSSSGVAAQRISSAGVPQWSPGGILLGTSVTSQWRPVIASDGAGGAVVVWTDVRTGDTNIYAQRVDAAGSLRWTDGGRAICTATHNQWGPAVIADGAGGVIVAWTDYRNGMDNDVYAQRVDAAGTALWAPEGVSVAALSYNQQFPLLVPDGAGGAIVSWGDQRSGTADIYGQRLDSGGLKQWSPATGVPICTAVGAQRYKQMVADGLGGAVLAWEDSRSGSSTDVYAQRVNSSGATLWAADGVPLCTAAGGQSGLALASDGAGGAVACWLDAREAGNYVDIYAQRLDAGGVASWTTDGVAVCTTGIDPATPSIAADGSGGAIVAWEDHRTLDTEIYAQRIDGNGTIQWTPGGVGALLDPGVQRLPSLAPDGADGTFAVWMEKQNGVYRIYARRFDDSGTAAWPARAVCTSAGHQALPRAMSDGSGGVVVTWTDCRRGIEAADIYAQRISSAGALAWPDSGAAVCSATGQQFWTPGVTSASGSVIVAWLDARGGSFDIYAQRIGSDGAPLWTVDGVPICTAVGQQQFPDDAVLDVMVGDGSGGAIVAWADGRSGNNDVYAQRVSAAGIPQWTADGVALCTEASNQWDVVLTTDGSGGALVVWEDDRSARGIYAQRVSAGGVPQWTIDGVPISSTGYGCYDPRAASDGTGGAIVAWHEYRWDTAGDVYAQRVNGWGLPQWPAGGLPVCSASGTQRNPIVISDGANGAIVTWLDLRTGQGSTLVDLYAQRLAANGTIWWPYNGVPLCSAADGQGSPAMLPDGSNGAIAAWEDRRQGLEDYVYLQRLDATGALRWSEPRVDPVTLSDLVATAGDGYVDLRWSAFLDAPATLQVLRSAGAGDPFQAVSEEMEGAPGRSDFVYRDTAVEPATEYFYKIGWRETGAWSFSEPIRAVTPGARFALLGITPNPAGRGPTRFVFALARPGRARLDVYDVAGKRVRTVAEGAFAAGVNSVSWDGRAQNGESLAAGVYFARLTSSRAVASKKFVVGR